MNKILFTIILVCFSALLFFSTKQNFTNKKPNPCTDFLSDTEFLEHMIPHHQVAVDMSILLQPISKSPIMHELFRKIIWQQNYEIEVMKEMVGRLPSPVSTGRIQKNYEKSKLSYYFPVKTKAKDGKCDPLFFKPNDHAKHMEHMEQTDKSYLQHMIPHHQVAVDMSERLLLHTNHSYLLYFARKLIVDQQTEIYMMNNLLKQGNYNYSSPLFTIPE